MEADPPLRLSVKGHGTNRSHPIPCVRRVLLEYEQAQSDSLTHLQVHAAVGQHDREYLELQSGAQVSTGIYEPCCTAKTIRSDVRYGNVLATG